MIYKNTKNKVRGSQKSRVNKSHKSSLSKKIHRSRKTHKNIRKMRGGQGKHPRFKIESQQPISKSSTFKRFFGFGPNKSQKVGQQPSTLSQTKPFSDTLHGILYPQLSKYYDENAFKNVNPTVKASDGIMEQMKYFQSKYGDNYSSDEFKKLLHD
jgi:hypothetical protein